MGHVYDSQPATPPRMRDSRSTSVAARASPTATHQHLFHRLSPRRRLDKTCEDASSGAGRSDCTSRSARSAGGAGLLARVHRLAARRWRLVVLTAAVIFTTVGLLLRPSSRPPLVIPKRPYTLHDYRHLDYTTPVSLHPATRVLHVTKEFGPATMGGLGVMLTALSIAQSDSPYLSISVALPHYSYLRDAYSAGQVQHFANLSVPFTTSPSSGRVRLIHCPVSLLRWQYTPASGFLDPARSDEPPPQPRSIDIYLIGPGEERPFSSAFRAKDEGDIYSAYKPLKQEWKDLYFARAAAELVGYLAAKDPATVFEDDELPLDADELTAPSDARRRADVAHLHGATNAMVAYYLREREREERHEPHLAGRTPAIVYTLHDSLDEVEYSNLVANVAHFVAPRESTEDALASLRPYIYRAGTQLFTSALGIDLADITTFVSRSITADIVSGKFRFHLEDLVMPSIAARAARGEFVGVTNGLDFTERSRNPFTNERLVVGRLAFPRVGKDVLDPTTFASSFSAAKDQARAFVVEHLPQFFERDDVKRPWLLFIGRYQYNKGCQLFSTLLEVLSLPTVDGRLILLGARNNYPFDDLVRLAKRYPRHLTLIDDRTPSTWNVQAEWGAHLRLASDIAFVPSLSEAFGLVAAEALLFGMPVLSTGVGGLREFLVPFPKPGANSYLFDLFPHRRRGSSVVQGAEEDYSQAAHDVRPNEAQLAPAREELRRIAGQALRDWRARRDGDAHTRELHTRRLVADALKLKWDRANGPVEEYIRVYSQALASRHRRLNLPGSLPPPVEPPSVSRLAAPRSSQDSASTADARARLEPSEAGARLAARDPGLGLRAGEGAGVGAGGRSKVGRAGHRRAGVLPIVKV